MVQIQKTVLPKHKETLPPYVGTFISHALLTPLSELPNHLATFPSRWPFPRGDLYHWISLLNRFDRTLEQFCKIYMLHSGPQLREFGCDLLHQEDPSKGQDTARDPVDNGDCEVIQSILDFSSLLLENCGNRSIYASSPYLNDLLNSTSLPLICTTLRIGAQLAQRYQASYKRISGPHRSASSHLLSNHYNIDLDRVQQLSLPISRTVVSSEAVAPSTPATPGSKTKDKAHITPNVKITTTTQYANDLTSLARDETIEDEHRQSLSGRASWNAWGEVRMTYNDPKTTTDQDTTSSTSQPSHPPTTPTPVRRTSGLSQQTPQRSARSGDETPQSLSRTPTFTNDESKKRSSLRVVELSRAQVSSTPIHTLLQETLPRVPIEMHYELLSRLRIAKGIVTSSETRRQVLAIRILAITNLAYIHAEQQFMEKVLKQDSEEPRRLQVTYQLAELIHPPSGGNEEIPRWLQTLAFGALEALAQHATKYQDVCSALNTSVSHGVLLYVVRKAVAEIGADIPGQQLTVNDSWRAALFSLLTHVATLPRAGAELVTAGLIPILVEMLRMRTPVAERSFQKTINFLDAVIFNVRDAFQLLVNAEGLDAISNLVVAEIKSATAAPQGDLSKYRSPATDYTIPYFNQQSIKSLFKFIHHMMTTAGGFGGNFDRLLRNLIDSSQFLSSLREVIENARVFGSTVWTSAVGILNDFINNEPASFSVIAEAGLSRAFLEAVTGRAVSPAAESTIGGVSASQDLTTEETSDMADHIEDDNIGPASADDEGSHPPTIDVLETTKDRPLATGILPTSEAMGIIPQTFGAICLNSAGMRMFQASRALESFFEIFESPTHVRCMEQDTHLPITLGATFDELVRHHPPLKNAVMCATIDMVARVGYLCKSQEFAERDGAHLWVSDGSVIGADVQSTIAANTASIAPVSQNDVEMKEAELNSSTAAPELTSGDAAQNKVNTTAYVNAASCYLTTVFSNTSLRIGFMEKGGIELVLDLAELPSLHEFFTLDPSQDSLYKVIGLLAEQKPHLLMPSLLRRIQLTTTSLEPLAEHSNSTAFFQRFVSDTVLFGNDPSANKKRLEDADLVKKLVNLQSLVVALRQCFIPLIYHHRSASTPFNQLNMTDYYVELVNKLGALLGASLREASKLRAAVPAHWSNVTKGKDASRSNADPEQITVADLPAAVVDTTAVANPVTNPSSTSNATAAEVEDKPEHKEPSKSEVESGYYKNFRILEFLLSKISPVVTPFFQSLGKSLISKRNPDPFHRMTHPAIADALAEAVLRQLKPFGEESSKVNFAYWTCMLETVKELLINGARNAERPSECITLVVQAFKDRNGFDTLNHMLEVFTGAIRDGTNTTVAESALQATTGTDLATEGVMSILYVYQALSTGKNVTEAAQTTVMNQRGDRERSEPKAFSSPQFLVELRMAILPEIRRLWESEVAELSSTRVVNKLIEIIRTIAVADFEIGAVKRTDPVISVKKSVIKPWKFDVDKLSATVDAGFSEDLAKEALFRCCGSQTCALEYCKAANSRLSSGRHPIPEDQIASINEAAEQSRKPSTIDSMVVDNQNASDLPTTTGPESSSSNFVDTHGDETMATSLANLLTELNETASVVTGENASLSDPTNVSSANDQQQLKEASSEPVATHPRISVDDLNEERAAIRENLIVRCLDVINAHGEVTFEVADLITNVVSKAPDPTSMRKDMGETLVNALLSFVVEDDIRPVGKKVAAYAHLLALLLKDKAFYSACILELKENLDSILGFIKISPSHTAEDSCPWVAHVLLVLEILLSEDAQPRETEWTIPTAEAESYDTPVLAQKDAALQTDERMLLFEAILEILPRIGKDESLALAVIRVLVILTRSRTLALKLGERKNLQRLFVMAKQLAGVNSPRLHGPLMIILRHIIEDDETIKQIMRSDIKALFDSQRQQRPFDVKHYLNALSYLVVRSPDLFVQVTNQTVKFAKWSPNTAENPGRQQLALQDHLASPHRDAWAVNGSMLPPVQTTEELSMDDVRPATMEKQEADEKPKQQELKTPVVEHPDGVIHFLLSELLNYRDVDDKEVFKDDKDEKPATQKAVESSDTNVTAAADDVTMSGVPASEDSAAALTKEGKKAKQEFKVEEHPIYVYRCFLLQCLTELLSSYNRTKIEFISFKRKSMPLSTTPSKPHSSVVNYLLFDLIPIGTLEYPESITVRKRLTTSSWADSVLTALLSKTGEQAIVAESDAKVAEDEQDLQFVRKFALDNVLKAYREASASTETLDIKYARMLGLADLMNHIMVGKEQQVAPGDQRVRKASEVELRRLMYEKGFVSALTASIADLDLQFPGAKRAVKYILRPLKTLTHTALIMSEEGKLPVAPGEAEEAEIASATSVSDVEDDREETPDLFRNSTLGMFEPGRDNESSSDEEDDDEDMYDEGEYDEEMEYEEEIVEDDEDNVSDEDEEIEGMGEVEGLSGDHGVDMEIVIGGEEEDEDEDDSDDDDDGEDEDSEDMDDMDDMEELEDMEDDEDMHGHEHTHIEIVDEEGNPINVEGDEEDEWQSDDEDDEEDDYDGHAGDEESGRLEGSSDLPHGPIGHLIRALGGDGNHGPIELLQHMEAGAMDADQQMDLEHDAYMPEIGVEDEDEDDEDMEDEEQVYDDYPGHEMPFGWEEEPIVITHRGGHHHRHRHGLSSHFPFFPNGTRDPLSVPDYRGPYRSHRPGPVTRNNDDGTNPLLQRAGNHSLGRDSSPHNALSPASGATLRAGDSLLDIGMGRGPFGESPPAILDDLLRSLPLAPGSLTHNGQALTFHVTGGGGRGNLQREFQAMFGMSRGPPQDVRRRDTLFNPGTTAPFYLPSTAGRWMDEAKMLFGATVAEKALRVIIGVLAVLVPPAIKADAEIRKIAAEKKKQEDDERLTREKKEEEERVAKEKLEAETAQALEQARAAPDAGAEIMMNTTEGAQSGVEGDTHAMEGVVGSTEALVSASAADTVPAENRPRVMMNIRGTQVDITDLGIDAEFLEELPDDIREEVITSAIAERRSQAAATGAPPSDIDQEFLDALPPEIREEIVQQERQDRRRREREEQRRQANQANGSSAGAQEMDAASILATLPSELRRQIIMEQDDDILAQLPPEYAAQAAQARASRRQDQDMFGGGRQNFGHTRVAPVQPGEPAAQKPMRRSIVQMLDKAGVATLLRLMFVFQQGSLRSTLFHVLQNISENRHNRAEVISTILHVLQDGSADMTAIERSFAHLSLRAKQPKEKEPKTPQPLKRTLTATGQNLIGDTEISPLLVVQQCLGALVYLSQVNLHVPSFFLTEHDNGGNLKRSASKKGKGKDTKAGKYALNSLLSLLDRKLIMESSSIMENLSDLLSRITAPLQALERKQKEIAGGTPTVIPGTDAVVTTASTALDGTTSSEVAVPPSAMEETETAATPHVTAADTTIAIPGTVEQSIVPVSNAETATDTSKETEQKKAAKPFVPPVVPEANLKLVINIFVARECSAKTFRETLSTIKNLSCIPGAKDVFGKELITKAQALGQLIILDLDQLLPQIQKASTGTEIQGVALAKFSPSGADQNKLLRVLTALDHLFDPKHSAKRPDGDAAKEGESSSDPDRQDQLALLYESSAFGPMWEKLSACLSAIRQREHMLNVATILLPLIESLMVVCKNTSLKESTRSQLTKETTLSSPPPESRIGNMFFSFTEEHRKILNELVRQSPKLMSGTFSLLVRNPKVLEFDNKRNYFTRSIHNRNTQARQSFPPLQLSVRRDQVFHDSFKSLYFKSGDEMKFGKLSIRFHGEEGVDAGGVSREWFQVLARQMFDPGYALFIPVSSDRTTFHPNHLSNINPEHLMFFKFIGRVIGKALYEGRVLDCHFSRAVYKRILGKSVSVKDMESLDPEYYKSVVWMLENDITDIITETFSVDDDQFGVVNTVDLIPDGRNIPVTQDNKHEYVRLMVEFKLTGSVQDQLSNFLKGFHEIIPAELVAIFNEQELELLISGLPEIDVDDWKNNTEYHQYNAASPQIQWFWRAIRSFDKEERAKMLQFVTGTSKVPLNGFKELEGMNGFSRFNIHRDYGNKDRLPTSHTCFNQLDLPEYDSYETLRQQVLMAITAGSEYFGFA